MLTYSEIQRVGLGRLTLGNYDFTGRVVFTMLAVITADLVHSGKAEQAQLRQAQAAVQHLVGGYRDGLGQWYRGDALQVALPHSRAALQCTLELGTLLAQQSLQLTLSLALGEGQLDDSVSTSQGSAFVLSGQGLDTASRGQWRFFSDHPGLAAEFQCTVDLLGFVVSQLTPKQAEVVHYWITHQRCDQATIAAGLGMTRQNVSLHWRKAAGPQLARCLEHFETRWTYYGEHSE